MKHSNLIKLAVIGCVLVRLLVSGALEQPGYANQSLGAPLKVSTEFQSEISQLASGGLKLKEALEASLDGSANHLAAIFQRDQPKAPNEVFEFRIIESDGRACKTIFRRADFFFSFNLAGESNKLNATDINGDGMKEIIVQSASGGNCGRCNPTEVYQFRNHKAELIAPEPFQRTDPLNVHGVAHVVVTYARCEADSAL